MVVDLNSGQVLGGGCAPLPIRPRTGRCTTPSRIGGVVHTHSRWATVFAQSGRAFRRWAPRTPIPFWRGALHARMTRQEIEASTSARRAMSLPRFRTRSPASIPAVLVHSSRARFAWGADALDALEHAIVLEQVACMAWQNLLLQPGQPPMQPELLRRHYCRKHGEKNAYYGQLGREARHACICQPGRAAGPGTALPGHRAGLHG